MFSKSKKSADKKKVAANPIPEKPAPPSIISSNLRITGDLHSDGEIHVDGTIEGDIKSQTVLVGESANIKGEINCFSVEVHGTVNGQIKSNTVSLAKTAHVTGDILHENLAIEKGAFLEGHCKLMETNKEVGSGNINLVIGDRNAATSNTTPDGAIAADPNIIVTPR